MLFAYTIFQGGFNVYGKFIILADSISVEYIPVAAKHTFLHS